MSTATTGEPVDERAQFLQADLPEHETLPVPGGLSGSDLPATLPAVNFRPAIVTRVTRLHDWLVARWAREQARGVAFLCVPVFMGTGAILYYALPFEPHPILMVFALIVPGGLLVVARGRSLAFFCASALLAAVAGMGFAGLETWRVATPMVGAEISTRVTGRVVRIEHQASGRVRLTLDVLATERPELSHPPGRVRLTTRAVPPDLHSGDVVQGFARLLPPSGPVRPGGYDFAFASYFNGIGATGFFLSDIALVDAEEEPVSLPEQVLRGLETVREALAARIREHVSGPHGEIAVALITGYRGGIPEEMNEALRRSGLAHVLSISGLHMALVAGTVMLMIRLAGAFFPVFASRVPVKKIAAAAALVFCTLYLSISGAEVAAQRSYIMLAVMLVALLLDRAAISMRNVAIAAIVILAVSPHEVVGPSFQMSFAATGALVAGFAAWTEWRSRRFRERPVPSRNLAVRLIRFMGAGIAGLVLTSLVAGAATTIYGVWHFQRASPLSLPANLVAMPVTSAVIMPSAVCAILALPFGLEGHFLRAMQWGIGVMVDIATWFSDRSPVDEVGLVPAAVALWFTLALLVLVISTTRLRWIAVPFIGLGLLALGQRSLPDVMVSEDARLVAVRGEGALAVNRARPSGLAMEDWKRALLAEEVIGPGKTEADSRGGEGEGRFICREGICHLRHPTGALVAHVQRADAAGEYCGTAAILIIEDATVAEPCGPEPAGLVLTGRELARGGAVAVTFAPKGGRPLVQFAVGEPFRRWHEHRAFSRAARRLPPRQNGKG